MLHFFVKKRNFVDKCREEWAEGYTIKAVDYKIYFFLINYSLACVCAFFVVPSSAPPTINCGSLLVAKFA